MPGSKRLVEDAQGQNPEASLLQTEAEELSAEVEVDYEEEHAVKQSLHKLRRLLADLPEQQAAVDKLAGYIKLLRAPVQPSMPVRAPARVEVVGSFRTHMVARPAAVVDVAIEIPKACFDNKDQLNHRYYAKRALYLAVVAEHLQKHAMFAAQTWELFNHDIRKPLLVITPQFGAGLSPAGFKLRLMPTIAAGTFPPTKLGPDRNNLRSMSQLGGSAKGEATLIPTPHYNMGVLQDMFVEAHLAHVQSITDSFPVLKAAVPLLKVWSRQQGLTGEPDAFDGFLLTMLALHLAEKNGLAAAMSPLQVVRAVLASLANKRTFNKGLVMERAPPPGLPDPPPLQTFRAQFAVVMLDKTGWLNLASHVSVSALAQAQAAAARSVQLLDSARINADAFEQIFLTRYPRTSAFDYFLQVTVPSPPGLHTSTDLPATRKLEAEVEALVRKALGSRALLVRAFRRGFQLPVQLRSSKFPLQQSSILVAVQVESSSGGRLVDMGPPADSVLEAQAFRAFWGEKAELRRFADGNIAESVVWDCSPAERHLIIDRLLTYILLRHLPQGAQIQTFGGVLDDALHQKGVPPDAQASASRLLDAAVERVEGSGKWPAENGAYKKTKAALGVQLAEALATQFGLTARASEAFVDILTDGFAIRLLLFTERDDLPVPGAPLPGFLRFLATLAQHPWSLRPLVVDPFGECTAEQQRAVSVDYIGAAAAGHRPALPICSPGDTSCAPWTRDRPTQPILLRLTSLAMRSLTALQALVDGTAPTPAPLHVFRPALSDYDVLIELRKDALPCADRSLPGPHTHAPSDWSSLADAEAGPEPPPKRARAILRAVPAGILEARGPARVRKDLLVSFDPVASYVQQLEARYGHLAVFCTDAVGGPMIGVKWDARAFVPAPMRLISAHAAMPLVLAAQPSLQNGKRPSPGILTVPNTAAVLAEMQDLGAGLVARIRLSPPARCELD
ncbi:hypothetical protein WJX72_002757 [[Myrmecia] bisecta]|uniref:Nucleolar protein 6 n=1 Tax=[Myrmecia] bisecta TaxID=41462 RepID=A0AAW1PWS5_9CHLO